MPSFRLPNVTSGVWCMSLTQSGTILTGIDVWKQRVYIVLNTPLGSDPLRPLFGCDWFRYIDKSVLEAGPKIKKEIIDAITIWVPEVKLNKVSYTTSAGLLVFNIQITIGGTTVSLPFQPGRGGFFGGIMGRKIINVALPYAALNVSLVLIIVAAGVTITPTMPSTGILTAAIDNGGSGYAVNDTFTVDTGSILATCKVTGVSGGVVISFVVLTPGAGYTITGSLLPPLSTTATSGGGSGLMVRVSSLTVSAWDNLIEMMIWLRNNLGQYGTWGLSRDELILYLNPAYEDAMITLTRLS